jgi:tetratricopeptide (TPR) repeat protein
MPTKMLLLITLTALVCIGSCTAHKSETLKSIEWTPHLSQVIKLSIPKSPLDQPKQNDFKVDGISAFCFLERFDRGQYKMDDELSILEKIARRYIQQYQYETAFQLLERMYLKNGTLWDIAVQYAEQGNYDKALQTVQMVDDDHGRSAERYRLLVIVLAALTKRGHYERTIRVARQMEDKAYRAIAIANIAKELAKAGQLAEANLLFSEALTTVETTKFSPRGLIEFAKDAAFHRISVAYAKVGLFEQALKVAERVLQAGYKTATLNEIAIQYGMRGRLDEAEATMALSPQETSMTERKSPFILRGGLLNETNTAVDYARAGLYEHALETLVPFPDTIWKVRGLGEVADVYIKSGQRDQASSILSQADQVTKNIQSGSEQLEAFIEMAASYSKLNRTDLAEQALLEAVEITKSPEFNQSKADLQATRLSTIAKLYAGLEKYNQAISISNRLKNDSQRVNLVKLFECSSQKIPTQF